MKSILLIIFCMFQTMFLSAQSDTKYIDYAKRIVRFSKPAKVLYKNIDAKGNGYIEFINAKKQILRFRLQDNKLQKGSCNIAFEIYYYENNYLKKIESLDINGNLIGCNLKLKGEAVTEYIIEKPALYLKKKKLIDNAEGNINMKDDSKEKIIRIQLFDENNTLIKEIQPTYISSKTYYDYSDRMSWP